MRRFFIQILILFIVIFLMFPKTGQSVEIVSVSAQNAVMIEQQSGRIMFDKNAHEQKPIASITKVMTAIIAIESAHPKDKVIASKEAVYTTGSSIYLQQDEKMSLEDLLYGLMLRSGNDAAVAIAEHIGGSEAGFVFLMNEKARYLGMTNTHFKNPHGLDEDGHYASAYDMAILMRYAMENNVFQEISQTKSYLSKNRTYHWHNKNKLLTTYYEHSTGGKTGYTRQAGRTLVTTADQAGLSFITVTLNAPDDWNDHRALFDWGYEHHELMLLEVEGNRAFQVEDREIIGYIEHDVVYPLSPKEQKALKRHVFIQQQPSDDKIGEIVYELHTEPILEVPVYEKVDQSEVSFLHQVINGVKRIIWLDLYG